MSMYCPYTYKGYPQNLDYPWIFPMPSDSERERRWQAIRKGMEKAGLDCLIASALRIFMPSSKDVYYISNYIPIATMGVYLVFPLKGDPQIQVNNFNGAQFIHFASEKSWIKDIVGSFRPIAEVVKKIRQLGLMKGRLGILGYDQGLFSGPDYAYLRKELPEADFSDASGMLRGAMNDVSRTSTEELAFLKQACHILDLTFEVVARVIKPAIRENELWAEVESTILKNGGWFPHNMLITSGLRPIFPRSPPSQRQLAAGDVAIFEVTATVGGVSPQICYAVSIGQPCVEVRKMFDFCEGLYQFSLEELEKEKTFREIELELARRIHAAGAEPMTPQIHIYNLSTAMPMDDRPQPGDYFTDHPNLCDPDFTFCAKLGDCIRIDQNGKVQRMNRTPARLNVIEV